MTVCYFGTYNPDYIRNKVLISGLEKNGVKVLQCQDRSLGLKKYLNLFKKHWQIRNQYNLMVVGFSSQLMVLFAKLLTKKKIVMDGLVPLYDALVYNHLVYSPKNIFAYRYWLLDYLSVHLADLVIVDTNQQMKFYIDNFHLKESKCVRIFVGANNEIFYPRQKEKEETEKDKFIVEFHALVFSEHGIDYIVKAAQILEKKEPEILFKMIGANKLYDEAREDARKLGLKNIVFLGRKPLAEIPDFLAEADVCLGLFGKTNKTQRVIPGKAWEIIASRKPFINADTPAMREIFTDRVNCYLCQAADANALAEAIVVLKNNPELRETVAKNGYELFQTKLKPKILGRQLKEVLERLN